MITHNVIGKGGKLFIQRKRKIIEIDHHIPQRIDIETNNDNASINSDNTEENDLNIDELKDTPTDTNQNDFNLDDNIWDNQSFDSNDEENNSVTFTSYLLGSILLQGHEEEV